MKIRLLVCWIALWLAGLNLASAQLIDRIVATVNGHIILQSDWDDELSFEALVDGRDGAQTTDQQRQAALDRLIDQELLRQQVQSSDFRKATAADIASRVEEIRKQYGAVSDQGWRSVLARYQLAENDLHDRVAAQIDVMRLIDARFRPAIQIDSKTIETYYNQQLLPQLRHAGGNDVPLAVVTPKIKELLTQKEINQMLTAWLQNLHLSAEIKGANSTTTAGGPAE